jgi:hypothetical protein
MAPRQAGSGKREHSSKAAPVKKQKADVLVADVRPYLDPPFQPADIILNGA